MVHDPENYENGRRVRPYVERDYRREYWPGDDVRMYVAQFIKPEFLNAALAVVEREMRKLVQPRNNDIPRYLNAALWGAVREKGQHIRTGVPLFNP